MKKTILFCLGLFFCTLSFVSCSDDDDDDDYSPYIVAPKNDIEFKGASLKAVKEGVQGTWTVEAKGANYRYIAIKGDRMIHLGGLTGCFTFWCDIVWTKVAAEDGSEMYAFYMKDDQLDLANVKLWVPFRIKDNVLFMGDNADENKTKLDSYSLLTEP